MHNNNLLTINVTADEITNKTHMLIKKSTEINNEISKIKINKDEDIHHFLEYLADDVNSFQVFHSICGFLQYVSPNENIRNASFMADLSLSNYLNELNLRDDIYNKLLEVKKYIYNKQILTNEDIIFIDKIILNYERQGIKLSKDRRDVLLKIDHEISKFENAIIKFNSRAENDIIKLSQEEMKGVPNHILNMFKNEYPVLNKTNYNIFMKYIDDPNIRKRIESEYSNRYKEIVNYICKLIALRDKHAKILSYSCYSDYNSQINMTKHSENIKNFLTELLHKLDTRYIKEIDTINKIASKYNSHKINSWDIQYYITKWKQDYGVNEQILREYFEFSHVLQQIFRLYEQIFGIQFKKVKIDPNSVWDKSVIMYLILQNDQKIGHLYLDTQARKGKYKQTRCFCIQPSCMYPYSNKKYRIPVIVLSSSFDNSLLTFPEVISIFHEMGHVMHHIFGKTKYIILSGINVENDFIETPAQLLDLLCWEKNIIKQLSCHYKTKQPLSDNIIEKIIKLKNLDLAIYYKRHIMIALLDQLIYSSDKFIESCEQLLKEEDKNNNLNNLLTTIYQQLHNEIMTNRNQDEKYTININPNVLLPVELIQNLCNNESQYYCSIWSRVLSSDMYNEKIKGKQLHSSIGQEMIDNIMKYGGTKPAYDMICNYMKRKPAIDGFISMHELDADIEFSFFLTTDQIKTPNLKQSQHITKELSENKQNKQNKQNIQEDEVDTATNRFSEVYESSVNFEDFSHQTFH
ncbi:peptidase [Klosneuvirus KNV1]|uniref:Peptidase n=1 Tax=Klosneuvirus KNV1 TaxID=1977640 RepID=A0A1V0SIU1_9VIRU|nr:peptidase [Klosneuvirus KNV1]